MECFQPQVKVRILHTVKNTDGTGSITSVVDPWRQAGKLIVLVSTGTFQVFYCVGVVIEMLIQQPGKILKMYEETTKEGRRRTSWIEETNDHFTSAFQNEHKSTCWSSNETTKGTRGTSSINRAASHSKEKLYPIISYWLVSQIETSYRILPWNRQKTNFCLQFFSGWGENCCWIRWRVWRGRIYEWRRLVWSPCWRRESFGAVHWKRMHQFSLQLRLTPEESISDFLFMLSKQTILVSCVCIEVNACILCIHRWCVSLLCWNGCKRGHRTRRDYPWIFFS